MTTSVLRQYLDLERIALGCVYLINQKAVVEFPNTTRSHPSDYAVVILSPGKLLRDGDAAFFPFKVPWDLWQNVVVPLLQGEGAGITRQFMSGEYDLTNPDWSGHLDQWMALLANRIDPNLQVGAGSIDQPVVTEGYPILDTQLAWIEGHKREQYPDA